MYSLGIINVFTSLQLSFIEGVEALATYPYGCCEQTAASTLPNIIAYRYLRATNKLSSEIEAKLLHNMRAGMYITTGVVHAPCYSFPSPTIIYS